MHVGQGRAGTRLEEQAAGHAQVHQQRLPLIQARQEIFPPAGQAGDGAACQGLKFAGLCLPPQTLVAPADRNNGFTHQFAGQPPADNLNFGQFRHF